MLMEVAKPLTDGAGVLNDDGDDEAADGCGEDDEQRPQWSTSRRSRDRALLGSR